MLTKEETTWEGEIQHSAIFGFIPASFVQNKKQKRFLFLGIEDKTVSDRAVVEEENQGRRGSAKKKKKKAGSDCWTRWFFPAMEKNLLVLSL